MTTPPVLDLASATLALWPVALAAGVFGQVAWRAPAPTPVPPAAAAPSLEKIEVALTDEPAACAAEPPAGLLDPAVDPAAPAAPADPAAVAVAPPGATPAFAVAVSGPVVFAKTAAAASATAARVSGRGSSPRTAAPVQVLTFGRGGGAQPAPDYPREARRKGREGSVTVRFAVAPDGRVTETRVVGPCAWSELNDAAEAVIRRRWRFPTAGAPRLYEITIRFTLTR